MPAPAFCPAGARAAGAGTGVQGWLGWACGVSSRGLAGWLRRMASVWLDASRTAMAVRWYAPIRLRSQAWTSHFWPLAVQSGHGAVTLVGRRSRLRVLAGAGIRLSPWP
jgi:hypothetical protein